MTTYDIYKSTNGIIKQATSTSSSSRLCSDNTSKLTETWAYDALFRPNPPSGHTRIKWDSSNGHLLR